MKKEMVGDNCARLPVKGTLFPEWSTKSPYTKLHKVKVFKLELVTSTDNI